MKLEDMQVLEKAEKLEALVARAELDTEYAIQVAWLGERQERINNAKVLVQNAKTLFNGGRIESLESDVRASAYANYHVQLDTYLKMFPEYNLNDVITESVGRHSR